MEQLFFDGTVIAPLKLPCSRQHLSCRILCGWSGKANGSPVDFLLTGARLQYFSSAEAVGC